MPLRKLFRNYYYGKPGKRDFTEADLPDNRLQLFKLALTTHISGLSGVNLLYLLCWIPAILWTFVNALQLGSIASMEAEAALAALDALARTYLVFLCPMIAITGPFNMGVSFVLRNWARDEHCFVLADGMSAMKENWKSGLLFGVISGIVPPLLYLCCRFYLQMARQTLFACLPLAIALIAALLWFLTAPILPTMLVTYRQRFFVQLRNALLMTLSALPRALALRAATLAAPLLLCLMAAVNISTVSWTAPLLLLLYAAFLPAFNKLIWASHANALCEQYLNPKIKGARTNIGLRSKEANDDDAI